MEDKTTPQLKPHGHGTILTGSDFLAGREAQLQAGLDEIEAELAGLGDVPDDVEGLEQPVLDALQELADLLKPPTSEWTPTPRPAQTAALPSAAHAHPGQSEADNCRKFRWAAGIVVILLLATISAFFLIWRFGLDLPGDNGPLTPIAQSTATYTPIPPTPTRPGRSLATATPIPSPTISAPIVPEKSGHDREIVQAAMVRILDGSGTLRLELPLSLMADTIQVVEGMPVLQPVLPASGAGVHRGSTPFGEAGSVIVAIPAGAALDSLGQARPGDRLVGCNSDGACHDYQVTVADTWPLGRLRQLLANWPTDAGVLLYADRDESSAWVVQAQPSQQEGTR